MAEPSIPVKEALSYGWAKLKGNLEIFVPLCLLSWAFAGLQAGINRWHGAATVLRWLLSPILMLVSIQLSISWVRAALKVCQGRAPSLSELLRIELGQLFNYLIGSLLYGLVVACGLLLLVVPGVLWAVKYCFVGFLIVDEGMDPLTAMRRSAELTAPVRGQLFFFGLALLGINLLGALALGVGLLATVPTSLLAMCHVYGQIRHGAKNPP